jgi:hypothetical protein
LILFHLMNSMVFSSLMSSVLSSIRLLLLICPSPLQIWQHAILLTMAVVVVVANLAEASPPIPMVAVAIEVVVVAHLPSQLVMVHLHRPLLAPHALFAKSATNLVMLPSLAIIVLIILINSTILLLHKLKLFIALRPLLMTIGTLTLELPII